MNYCAAPDTLTITCYNSINCIICIIINYIYIFPIFDLNIATSITIFFTISYILVYTK